jgi:hypothetical protein
MPLFPSWAWTFVIASVSNVPAFFPLRDPSVTRLLLQPPLPRVANSAVGPTCSQSYQFGVDLGAPG